MLQLLCFQMYAVLCAFDDRETALASITRMIRAGVARDDIHVQPELDCYAEVPREDAGDKPADGRGRRWLRLLGSAFRTTLLPGAEGTYRDAIRRGNTVVVVHVASAEESLDAAALMTASGAFDVEPRKTGWAVPR